jgi:peptide/nickel transport system ATP-binding protein
LALAAEPDFLVADEPTTALDVTIQAQILDLLKRLQRERRMGLLLITHDLAVVSGMAHRVALMYAGQIVEVAEAKDFFREPRHPYAQALLRALPGGERRGQPLEAIAGTVPALNQTFNGCRFATRCAHVMERCHSTVPQLVRTSAGHAVRCLLYTQGQAAAPLSSPVPRTVTGSAARRAAGAPALLDVRHLQVRFPIRRGILQRVTGHFNAVDDVSFQLAAGETLALVGESGCGKTTTGKAVLQLLRHLSVTEGEALLDGQNLFELVLDEGLAALQPELSATDRRGRIEQLADRVGLRRDALNRYPHEFSGGQRQRIAIARALAVQPKVIVCDEPTSALDVSVQAQILNLLKELQRELGVSYLFITHNIGVVEYIADRIVVMKAGRIVEQGLCAEVLSRPAHAYTQGLLAAVPRVVHG